MSALRSNIDVAVGLRLWKHSDCKEERMTKVGLYVIGTSTTLASNKSLRRSDVSRLRCTSRDLSLRHACVQWPSHEPLPCSLPSHFPARRGGAMAL